MAERYRLKIKSLKFLSAVDQPAQADAARALLLKRAGNRDEVKLTARTVKTVDELGLVFGYAFASSLDGGETPYVDLQRDAIEPDFLKAAMEFIEAGGATDVNHDRDQDGRVVFAWPLVPEINAAMGITAKTVGLAVAVKPSTETFAAFKRGELTGFSIDGEGFREAMKRTQASGNAEAQKIAAVLKQAHQAARKGSPLDHELEDRLQTLLGGMHDEDVADLGTLADAMHADDSYDEDAEKSLRKSRFSVLSDKLAAKGADDPDALAAYIGRKKYGSAAMARMAARGRRKKSARAVAKAAQLTTAVAGHVHMLDDSGDAGETDCRSMPGVADGGYHTHPWLRVGDQIVIGEAENHTHEVADLEGAPDDDEDDAAKRAGISTPKQELRNGGSKETNVDPKELKKQLDEANAKLGAISKLSTTAHALWKSLSGADADAFLAKSDADRAPMIAEFEKGNAVEYTAADGTVYTKRDDARLIAMAKRADEQAAALADEKLAKRAAETFGKATDAGKDVLKAVDGIADQKRRDAALALVKGGAAAIEYISKANDTRLREGFELPENAGGPAPVESPETALSKAVAKYQADHKLPTPQQALNKALRELDPTVTAAFQAARN